MRLICVSIATLALTLALPPQFAPRYNRRANDLEAAIYDELVDAFALDPVISAALDGNVDIAGGDVAGITDNIADINAMTPAALIQYLRQYIYPHWLLQWSLHQWLHLYQYQWLNLYQYQWLHLYQLLRQ
ncbi:hypothetical protein GGF37_000548 [Kickxella alabastrina]|nr:hypothetical protein GGF37_000548 [Kickxella alabastrina]